MFYPNLEAELKRRGVTRLQIADDFGLSISTVSCRLTGKSQIPLTFAEDLKRRYSIEVPLEELFAGTGRPA
ncbi:MAG TPA: helix-turn-helix transcriptional regulator [Eubacteriales bacterium]|nr:helix-turn-helix transcriptional regulator [Eubacteriales bacterium]